ncbi:MAG: hypothetical protein F7C37_06895 [Desulfurococcales archaeon]|nr:hypothetical protein [Desulfurococcales archaeon]MCE4622491.1 hypothetical protein [Desulfurococcales archaeon]MCE4626978.1 hypothetical protein [Desulfurococcales archaeon]
MSQQCACGICSKITKYTELYASLAFIMLIALIILHATIPSIFESVLPIVTFSAVFFLVLLLFPFWVICKILGPSTGITQSHENN